MTVSDGSIIADIPKRLETELPQSSLRFDWLIALLSCWFVFGVYLDGWAHSHLPESLESFLTPWHGVLYTGMLSIGFALVSSQMRNVWKGYRWRVALPKGYLPSLFGFMAFASAGVFDFMWHEAFGSEADIEALLSPAHMFLAISGFIVVTGPLRSAWDVADKKSGWKQMLPLLISATLAVSVLTFFTEYVHFYNTPVVLTIDPGVATAATLVELEDPRFLPNVYGVMSIVVPSLLLTTTLLFLLVNWELPIGSMTFVLSINSALMFFMSWGEVHNYPGLLILMVITGVVADTLLYWLKPSTKNVSAFRLFAFIVPFMMALLYIIVVSQSVGTQTGAGLWWKIHMWLGVPFVAALGGLLVSILLVPSATGIRQSER